MGQKKVKKLFRPFRHNNICSLELIILCLAQYVLQPAPKARMGKNMNGLLDDLFLGRVPMNVCGEGVIMGRDLGEIYVNLIYFMANP